MINPSSRPTSAPALRTASGPAARVISIAIGLATAVLIFGFALGFVFNPAFVGFEQERAQADAWTGWPMAEVHRVTDIVVGEVLVGPGTFDVMHNGAPVFDPAEAQHMVDVRRVMLWLESGVLVSAVVIGVAAVRMRDRRRFWSAISTSAKTLIIGMIVVGGVFAIAFDQAFEIFHELLFPAGSYTFDPSIEHLVQLFPEQLFSESTIVMGIVGIIVAAIVWRVAGRRARHFATLETTSATTNPTDRSSNGGGR